MRLLKKLAQESIASLADERFVGNRIDDETCSIMISCNQLAQLIFRVA
jgi:hypothetical protein